VQNEFIDHETPRITLDQLSSTLQEIDPRVILVAPHVLRYIIKADLEIGDFWAATPHYKTHIVKPSKLKKLDILAELDLDPARDFPKHFILLVKPDLHELGSQSKLDVLIEYWRYLFHARVHLDLHQLQENKTITDKRLEQLFETIGQVEFSEIKEVLYYENFLGKPDDHDAVLIEFCACFLELRYFSRDLRRWYFPTLAGRFDLIDTCIDELIDSEELFNSLRPSNVPDPNPPVEDTSEEPQETFHKLISEADEQFRLDNYVRAAILRIQATRIAPGGQEENTRNLAREALLELTSELEAALDLDEESKGQWRLELFEALLEKSDQGKLPGEARLLFDLQNICVEARWEVYDISLLQFVMGKGWRMPLPHQKEIRIIRHLESVKSRLPAARLKSQHREDLKRLINRVIENRQARLRQSLQPELSEAFKKCGISAQTVVDKVSLDKITSELLDTIIDRGFLHYSTLRDTFSRNDYKIRDVLFSRMLYGDSVIRLNKELKKRLPDVYKAGEIYHTVFHRVSDVFSGNRLGEFMTWWLILPFGVAVGSLFTLEHLFESVIQFFGLKSKGLNQHDFDLTSGYSILIVGVLSIVLLHSKGLRRLLKKSLFFLWTMLKALFTVLPRYFMKLALVQKILRNHWVRQIDNFVLRPLRATTLQWIAWWLAESPRASQLELHLTIFVIFAITLNTSRWETMEEGIGGWFRRGWDSLHDKSISLLRFVQLLVKTLGEFIEKVLYAVDERLRYRKGDHKLSMVAKIVMTPLWLPTRYIVRMFYMTCIDPRLNPAKLGIVFAADKVLSPFTFALFKPMSESLERWVALPIVPEIAASLLTFAPAAFVTFVIWELKENRKLFISNRPREMKTMPMTEQGQTLAELLNPANYGNTLPAIYARLRKYERQAQVTGDWVRVRRQRDLLEEIKTSLLEFLEREFLAVLVQTSYWDENPLKIAALRLGHNNIFVRLVGTGSGLSMTLLFEWASGWVRTAVLDLQRSESLDPNQRASFEVTLIGLYKKSGVDLVRRQVDRELAKFELPVSHQMTQRGLKVWPVGKRELAVLYQFEDGAGSRPLGVTEGAEQLWQPLAEADLYFSNVDLDWAKWTALWDDKQSWDLMKTLKLPPLVFGDLD
jgi:hypothetical protein